MSRQFRKFRQLICVICVICGWFISAHAQNLSLLRSQCLTGVKGSRRAADFLAELKRLPASQERDDAVGACEARVNDLRKSEDAKWTEALQARQTDCNLAKRLFNELANQGLGTFYQRQAGEEARALNCSGAPPAPSGDSGACTTAQNNLRNAQGSLNINNFDQAKKYAIAAQACAATSAEAASLVKRIDERALSQKLLGSVTVELLRGNKARACDLILQIPDPAYPGVKENRAKAGGCEAPAPPPPAVAVVEPPKPMPPPTPDPIVPAKEPSKAPAVKPAEVSSRDVKQQAEERMAQERAELSRGINAYYQGKYGEAKTLLAGFVDAKYSARATALASFYLGAVSASEYFLSGQQDESKKQEASRLFGTLKDDRVFSPDWNIVKVSPKVQKLFVEAAGK